MVSKKSIDLVSSVTTETSINNPSLDKEVLPENPNTTFPTYKNIYEFHKRIIKNCDVIINEVNKLLNSTSG